MKFCNTDSFSTFFERLSFKPGGAFILILIYHFSYFLCEGARPLCYRKHLHCYLGRRQTSWAASPGNQYRESDVRVFITDAYPPACLVHRCHPRLLYP